VPSTDVAAADRYLVLAAREPRGKRLNTSGSKQ
jgi:hypothetical protein